jgi:hypothetical protein
MTCNHEDLLGLARGDLPPARADEVEAHAESCAECARELAWLRTERALFRAQSSSPSSHVWQGIERRIVIQQEQRREQRQRLLHVGSGVTVLAAAASVLFYISTHGGLPLISHRAPGSSTAKAPAPVTAEPAPGQSQALAALDAAELEYRSAIRRLEKTYHRERDRLDPDEAERVDGEIRKLKQVVATERAAAQDDVWARRRVLKAYSATMRTMQAVVLEVPK